MTEVLLILILFVQLYSFRVSRLHMERTTRWLDFNVAWMRDQIIRRDALSPTDFNTDNELLNLLWKV